MRAMAEKQETASELRRQYVYQQKIRTRILRTNGKIARDETREYTVAPTASGTEKKLTAFRGELHEGKQVIVYDEPGYVKPSADLDGGLIKDLTDDLVNDEDSRDGISPSLFPLRRRDIPKYTFKYRGATKVNGRPAHRIAFEPRKAAKGEEEDFDYAPWKGEAWIDTEDLQPVRIATDLAFSIPWGVKVFLGTNLRQTGFSVTYQRVAPDVWFPATYGTEFRIDVFFGYKRTITQSLESRDFRKAAADSTITYEPPK